MFYLLGSFTLYVFPSQSIDFLHKNKAIQKSKTADINVPVLEIIVKILHLFKFTKYWSIQLHSQCAVIFSYHGIMLLKLNW